MSETALKEVKRPHQTNDLGYTPIIWESFEPLGDRILVEWEQAQNEMRVGKVTLLRSVKHEKLHYTGIVRKVGPDVLADYPEIKPGARLLFDQFSNFDKFFDPELGRMALIRVCQQASAFAIIPDRVIISSAQSDYNYDL